MLRRPAAGACPAVAPGRRLRRRPSRGHARHLSRPAPRLCVSDHAARRAMGRYLDRSLARGGNQRAFRYVVRHGVGFAGKGHGSRFRRLDGDSVQEPAFPGRQAAGMGNHFVSRHHAQDGRFILAARFLQGGGTAGAGCDSLRAGRNFSRPQHRTDSLRLDARLPGARHARSRQSVFPASRPCRASRAWTRSSSSTITSS